MCPIQYLGHIYAKTYIQIFLFVWNSNLTVCSEFYLVPLTGMLSYSFFGTHFKCPVLQEVFPEPLGWPEYLLLGIPEPTCANMCANIQHIFVKLSLEAMLSSFISKLSQGLMEWWLTLLSVGNVCSLANKHPKHINPKSLERKNCHYSLCFSGEKSNSRLW